MNWLVWTLKILATVPAVVQGIEVMTAGAKQGATKKQLAMAALGLSSGVANNLLPEHKPAIEAATVLASNAIDGTVALMNAIGHPDFATKSESVVTRASEGVQTAVPTPTTSEPAPEFSPGPGLHNVVPA